MEDLEMSYALRRYVEAGEPPFPLTANALISQARRRQRWRVGLGIGGGGAATTLAIVSAITLVPAGGGGPTLGAGGCDVLLPLGPGATASIHPPIPTGRPDPTTPPTSPANPPTSQIKTPDPLGSPASGAPTPVGDNPKKATPAPTVEITPLPGGGLALPSQTSRPVPGAVDIKRLNEMSCFLKHRLLQLRPNATFGPEFAPPMEVIREADAFPGKGSPDVYRASAYVIDGQSPRLILITVSRADNGMGPGLVPTAKVTTKSSTIVVSVQGGVITDEQAIEIAKAPELDLYR